MGYGRRPWVGECESGTLAFCACGESENKPYCDGSHSRKKTGKTPHIVELTETQRVAICQCGTSGTKPFCDGSHKKLPPE
jgi:CDGSH-type Zn-finger protein